MDQRIKNGNEGFILIDALLASALFGLLATVIVGALIYGEESSATGGSRARAVLFAEEGLEAVRNIRDARFRNLNLIDGTYGLTMAGNKWFFTGMPDTYDIFTRTITISSVDTKRKSVTSTVSWQQNAQRTGTVSLVTYVANWQASSQALTCDWSGLAVRDTFNSSTNTHDAVKVQTDGQYAYLAYAEAGGDTMDFAIVDTQGTPTLVGSLNLLGSQNNIAVSGNYAYIASDSNTAELQVVDTTNPNAPVARGVFDASGSADGKGVFVVGTTAYLVRDGSADLEFYIIDVSNPDAPTAVSSVDLGGTTHGANEIYVAGALAYVSSVSNTQEVKVVDISNPSSPVFNSSDPNYAYDIPSDSNDGIGLTGFDAYVIIGNAAGKIHILDTHTSPPYVTFRSEYLGNDRVNDLALGEDNRSLFVASSNNVNEEFEVVDISTISSPVGVGALQNTTPFYGVAFAESSCAIIAVSGSATLTPELSIIEPSVDTVAPSAVVNLAAPSSTATSIDLTWTAPGDDGTTGTAASYDIRYSTSTITEGNFASASQATGEPTPQAPGTAQSMTVSGLASGTLYYFAIKSSDEVPNTSSISNIPNRATTAAGDTTAPTAVTDLSLSGASGKSILLTWTAPGDDGTTGTATSYDIRYSTSTITEGNFASATESEGEPTPQAAGTVQTMRVSGLNWNTTYYFAMKTSDEVPNTSTLSNAPNLTTRTQASYLVITTSTARSNAPSDTTQMINITIENSATEAAESSAISQMSATWSGAGNYRLNGIRISGTDYWTGTATKGTLVTLSPSFTLSSSTTYPVTYLDYNNTVIGLNGNVIRFVMSDGSLLDSSSFSITQ
jgi:hypothetical protein